MTGSSSGAAVGALMVVIRSLLRRCWPGRTFAVRAAAGCAMVLADGGLIRSVLNQELDPRNAGHRLNSVAAILRLLGQESAWTVLLEHGQGAAPDLYLDGVLIDNGFYAVDNQYVNYPFRGGLVGAVLIVIFLDALTVRIARQSGQRYITGWLGLLAMGSSFDLFAWYATATLFVVYAALALPPEVVSPPAGKNVGAGAADRHPTALS